MKKILNYVLQVLVAILLLPLTIVLSIIVLKDIITEINNYGSDESY